MAGGRSGRDLNATPTWAVALVSAVIVLISILLEKLLHGIGKAFEKKKKKALVDALEKIKGELMVLGFISLLLTFGQNYIAKICISEHVANTMLPCPLPPSLQHDSAASADHSPAVDGHSPPGVEGHDPPGAEGHDPPGKGGGDYTPAAEGHDNPPGQGEHAPAGEGHDNPPDKGEGGHPDAGQVVHPDAVEGDDQLKEIEGDDQPKEIESGHLQIHPVAEAERPPKGGDHHPVANEPPPTFEGGHRRLLWDERRILSADSDTTECLKGTVPVISINGLHQLHIFIFFLAVCHVIFGAITMSLGRLKIGGWKEWEQGAVREEEISNDASRFRLTHETSFVRDNASLSTTPILFYPVCFFRQFVRSVRRADYLTMRHGFIAVHLSPGSKFDFQKYIMRSLEDDFKVVVGISPPLWGSAVLFLLLNVKGWQVMLWLTFLPLVIILAVGMKLQAIIAMMAVEIQERHAVVQGIPLVHVSDKHFWFGKPHFILHLIHFTLFLNAFEITYMIWITYEYGLESCFHEDFKISIVRLIVGLAVQVVCSYITLPLYALVTQMGSHIKKSVFDDQTNKALTKWTMQAKKKQPTLKVGTARTQTLGGDPGSRDGSPEGSPRRSGLQMSKVKAAAGITAASVDIPEETPPSSGAAKASGSKGSFPDLLTGP